MYGKLLATKKVDTFTQPYSVAKLMYMNEGYVNYIEEKNIEDIEMFVENKGSNDIGEYKLQFGCVLCNIPITLDIPAVEKHIEGFKHKSKWRMIESCLKKNLWSGIFMFPGVCNENWYKFNEKY